MCLCEMLANNHRQWYNLPHISTRIQEVMKETDAAHDHYDVLSRD